MECRILFIREFPIIDAADSAEKLRMRLKNEELEQYGEQFIPDFVYDVIRQLPRFASMRVSQTPLPSNHFILTFPLSVDINRMLKSFSDFFWKKCMRNAQDP